MQRLPFHDREGNIEEVLFHEYEGKQQSNRSREFWDDCRSSGRATVEDIFRAFENDRRRSSSYIRGGKRR